MPYRNSKLTRILKDSLGDNCKTVMLAAVRYVVIVYFAVSNTLLALFIILQSIDYNLVSIQCNTSIRNLLLCGHARHNTI